MKRDNLSEGQNRQPKPVNASAPPAAAGTNRDDYAPSASGAARNAPFGQLKVIGLGIALLAALTGCVGYVDGGYYGGPVVVPGPSVYFYGGGYERGRDVRVYSHRGYESRAVAHPAVRGPERRR